MLAFPIVEMTSTCVRVGNVKRELVCWWIGPWFRRVFERNERRLGG